LSLLGSQLVIGETSQSILQVEYLPEMPKEVPISEHLNSITLHHKLRYRRVFFLFNGAKIVTSAEKTPRIILSDELQLSSLEILLDQGLWSRCGDQLKAQWKAQMEADATKRREDKKEERKQGLCKIDGQVPMLKKAVPFYLVDTVINLYPYACSVSQHVSSLRVAKYPRSI